MKQLYRRTAALTFLALLLITLCAPVFAGELEQQPTAVSAADAPVSGSDTVSPTDHIALYPLEKISVDEHRLSMLAPKMAVSLTSGASNSEISSSLGETWGIETRQDLLSTFDYSSGTSYSYLYSGISENRSIYIYVIYQENAYTRHIGSYRGKSADELEDICANTDLLFGGDYSVLRSIHGNTYVFQEGVDESYGYYSYAMETIINGGRYNIYIDLTDATESDKTVAADIIDSLRIGGKRASLSGAAEKSAVIILSVCVAVLAALVLLLGFFIVRFGMFSKAAGSSFNIIGFNLPPSAKEIERIMSDQDSKSKRSGK